MNELLQIPVLPMLVTLAGYGLGLICQKKWNYPLVNPIVIGMAFVIAFLSATGMEPQLFTANVEKLQWVLTPATICLAIPMYQRVEILKRNKKAIAAGVSAGAIGCLIFLLAGCLLFRLNRVITVSLLPKSITAAVGVPLSELFGGIGAVTVAGITITGISTYMLGVYYCKWFHITEPVAVGVALGTTAHVIGAVKATELDPLSGAVGNLALVVTALLSASVFPVIVQLVPA